MNPKCPACRSGSRKAGFAKATACAHETLRAHFKGKLITYGGRVIMLSNNKIERCH